MSGSLDILGRRNSGGGEPSSLAPLDSSSYPTLRSLPHVSWDSIQSVSILGIFGILESRLLLLWSGLGLF